jgi:hypothetical protein
MYDSMTIEQNNYPNGGLDKDTGIFIAPKSGVFATSFFFSADNNKGTGNENAVQATVNFQKNSENLPEGKMFSSVFSTKDSYDDDSGGKSILVKLEKDDKLSVFLTEGNLNYVAFCIHSL